MAINVKSIPGILYSKNVSFSYKFRNKMMSLGIPVEYVDNEFCLIDFILDNTEGIIFIDNQNVVFQQYILKYSKNQLGRNFSFVFLDDFLNPDVDIDNCYSFISSFDRIHLDLNQILLEGQSRIYSVNSSSKKIIDEKLDLLMTALKIPYKLVGYTFLKDALRFFVDFVNKKHVPVKEIYDSVATKHNTTSSNVEKSIRFVISRAVESNPELYNCVFKKTKVSNLEFLCFIIGRLKMLNKYENSLY